MKPRGGGMALAGSGVVLALAAALAVGARPGPPAHTPAPPAAVPAPVPGDGGEAWQWIADGAFDPVQKLLKGLMPVAIPWLDGRASDREMVATADRIRPEFQPVRNAVAALPPPGSGPDVRPVYQASAGLYLEFVRMLALGAASSGGADQTQFRLSARRLQVLADRTYDAGRRILGADPRGSRIDAEDADIVVLRAPAVPDWAAEGLAAVASRPPPTSGTPRPRDLVAAIDGGSGQPLGKLALLCDRAAGEVRRRLDPFGAPASEAAAGLGWLILGEAARVGQLSGPADGIVAERLRAMARRLVALGEPLAGVPPEAASGLDPAIAREDGP